MTERTHKQQCAEESLANLTLTSNYIVIFFIFKNKWDNYSD